MCVCGGVRVGVKGVVSMVFPSHVLARILLECEADLCHL